MAVSQTVFIFRSRLPTAENWQTAIQQLGFPLFIDQSFAFSDSYMTCRLFEEDTGFEILATPRSAFDFDAMSEITRPEFESHDSGYDTAVSFISRDETSMSAAMTAACVLCHIGEGVLYDEEGGSIFIASEVLGLAEAF